MEKNVQFGPVQQKLSGRVHLSHPEKGVVITHPHPLYGGNMDNPVVEAVSSAYQKRGFTTLVFNFRGVGQSQGQWDDGVGEQDDAIAAVGFLAENGISKIDLAGYSFGAWIHAHIHEKITGLQRMIMVSPPVQAMPFPAGLTLPALRLVVTGSRDEIAPAPSVEKMAGAWNPEAGFEVLDGADHFYMGALATLEEIVYRFLPEASNAGA